MGENPSVALRYDERCCCVNEILLVSDHNTVGGLLSTNPWYPMCPILHMASVGSRGEETDSYTK